jgi:hypothetical protein
LSTQTTAVRRRLFPDARERASLLWSAHNSVVLLVVAWLGGGALLLSRLNQGWMYHDDGSMAHAAERVLGGQLPHRDFADLYTGGLAFFDAGIFWLFGNDLYWLRLPILLLFLLFVPCVYALARRFVGPPGAFAATAFAIAWSVPAYPAPMPTWYLLYLSVFGAYCVTRYLEGGRRWWLLAAGLLGGLSLTIKIVGVWYIAAVLIALAAAQAKGRFKREMSTAPVSYRLLVAGSGAAGLALVVAVMHKRLELAAFITLVVPLVVLACAVGALAWRGVVGTGPNSLRTFSRDTVTFLLGVAVPLCMLLAPYVVTGSLRAWIDGVLIAPQTRFEFAYDGMDRPTLFLWAMPVAAYVVARARIPLARRRGSDVIAVSIVLGYVIILMLVESSRAGYLGVWKPAQALGPFVIALGALALVAKQPLEPSGGARRDTALLLVLLAGFMSMVQFPFSAPIYYLYVAPLLMLAALAASSYVHLERGLFPAVIVTILVLFGLRFIDRQDFWTLGVVYRKDPQIELMHNPRASIRVTPAEVSMYRRVASVVRLHARSNVVYAGPDAPEIYYLTDKSNPTRSILDFLDMTDSARGAHLLSTLETQDVSVIVINRRPMQSLPHPPQVLRTLRERYPIGVRINRFEVRWNAANSRR